jgi:uncharacterized protein (TIGR02231 family)
MPNILIKKETIDLTANSSVKEVTVFSDKALVKREMKINLLKNENTVVFKNLGLNIIEESIKVRVNDNSVNIISSTLVQNSLFFFKEDENDNLYNEIISSVKELIRISDEINIYSAENNIIHDLRNYIELIQNRIILEKDISIFKLKESLSFLEKRLSENSDKKINLEYTHKKLYELISNLKNKLEIIKNLDSKIQSNIEITLFSGKECEVIAEISYILPNAGWSAGYDMILDRKTNDIDFYYYGNIYQTTGENWDETDLILSTVVVDRSIEIPQIYPAYLSVTYQKRDKELVLDNKEIKEDLADSSPEEQDGQSDVQLTNEPDKKMIGHTFKIEKKSTIPSDGKYHKVVIISKRINGDICYETIPELMAYVYLKAVLKNNTGLPLLAGSISIYRNGCYTGRSKMKYTAPDDKIEISFGIDNDIKVKRVVHWNNFEKSKSIIDKNVREKGIKFILYNYTGVPQKVILKEGIYVSELNEVSVSIKPETTKDYIMDKDGIVKWEVSLTEDPLKLAEIMLVYKIDANRSFDIANFS